MTAGDFDPDGVDDLAAVDFAGGKVHVYRGVTGGLPQYMAGYATGLLSVEVLAGAFFGSASLDLVVLRLVS